MRSARWFVMVATLLLATGSPWRVAAGDPMDADEEFLRRCKVPTDNAGLLAYLRECSAVPAGRTQIEALIRGLSSDRFREREEATRRLKVLGVPALPALRRAQHSNDGEVVRRARECLTHIYQNTRLSLPLFVTRLLVRRRVEGSVEALLRYLPYAQDQEVEEEIWFGLDALARTKGEVHPGLAAALTDERPQRRAVAACLLGRLGTAEQRAAVRKLLSDADPWVRLRAAQGLLAGKDKTALPVLVALLGEKTPVMLAWQAEELLHWVAGDGAPEALIGVGKEADRARCRAAWQTWWRKQGPTVDLSRESPDHRRPGLVLVWCTRPSGGEDKPGRICLYGCRGKPRWELNGVNYPVDVTLLPTDRVLIAGRIRINERAGQVTERDLEGKVVWEYRVPAEDKRFDGEVCACRRLANGNTAVLWVQSNGVGCVDDITPEGEKVFPRKFLLHGWGLPHGRLLPNGDVFDWTEVYVKGNSGDSCRYRIAEVKPPMSKDGWPVEVKDKWSMDVTYKTSTCRFMPLPDGHILVANNEAQSEFLLIEARKPPALEELDRAGKKVATCPFPYSSPIACPLRLRNGNMLVVSEALSGLVVEVDRQGRPMWELLLPIGVNGQRVCMALVRLGLDQPRPADWSVDDVAVRTRQLRSGEQGVRDWAVQRLGRHGPKALAAVPDLINALDGPGGTINHSAETAIYRIGPKAVPFLLKAVKDKRPNVRAAAVLRLAVAHDLPDWPIQVVLEALKDPHPLVREYACRTLNDKYNRKHYAEAVPALVPVLKDKEVKVASAAAFTLGDMGPRAATAVPALIEMLKSPDKERRAGALQAFASIGPPAKAAVPELLASLRDKKREEEWRVVISVLGCIGPGAAATVPRVIEVLEHGDETTQSEAIWALGRIGTPAKVVVPLLTERIRQEKENISDRAIKALGEMGPAAKDAVPMLMAALKVNPKNKLRIVQRRFKDRIREEAIIALGKIGPNAQAAIPALIEAEKVKTWLGGDPSPELKGHIQQALKRIKSKPSLP